MKKNLSTQPTSAANEAIKTLEDHLHQQLKEELLRHKQKIHAHLSYAIALRYYRKAHPNRSLLHRDPYIQKAQEVLRDSSYYAHILGRK